ncbi:MAG: hydroxymethylglutaryl-CoA reductase, degradative [Planctomycetes bacterium]|nr:hydroxymethylglutaryl-CoA reductase, degradative [Planctomycetota bacterium]
MNNEGTPSGSSRLPGFHRLPMAERVRLVAQSAGLTDEERAALGVGRPPLEEVDALSENAIGVLGIPLGVATNFRVNGRDVLVPMATEESSVVAGASHGAKMVREGGGFRAESTDPLMEVQVCLDDVADPASAAARVEAERASLLAEADACSRTLPAIGGGARDLRVRVIDGDFGPTVVVHLGVDVRDAMGANVVNTMGERLAPRLESLLGGRAVLRVIDNYAVRRIARARATVPASAMGGPEAVAGVLRTFSVARHDVHRAVGHNKGMMNGVTAVVLATGNDTRAFESCAHAYAARTGAYRPLPVWGRDAKGDLTADLELPVPVGIVGGLTRAHPTVRAVLKILGVKTARELGEILVCVGLASKLAAEHALATAGIQRGHMRLHASKLAALAGAQGAEIAEVAARLVSGGDITAPRAADILREIRK